MRFLHTADLHIGKRVNEFSMLEDQEYILRQILKTADKEQVEAVLIAGDVYDKQVPSAEAVRLFDWFLTQLNSRKLPVLSSEEIMTRWNGCLLARRSWRKAGFI